MKTRSVLMPSLALVSLWMTGCGGKSAEEAPAATSKAAPNAAPVKEGAGQVSGAPAAEANPGYQSGVGTKAK